MPDEERTRTLRLDPIAGPPIDPILPQPDTGTLLGRGAECGVLLADASVSRRHASVGSHGDLWLVTDLGSRHGTFVNGVRLDPHRPTPTGHGDLLRIGPFMFRVTSDASASHSFTTIATDAAPGALVESVPEQEVHALAHRRLAIMIEGTAAIYQASTEVELARAAINLIISGTGFSRAAMLRWGGSDEQVEVIAFDERTQVTSGGFTFSRSLLRASATGRVARLAGGAQPDYGQSIERLGISSALAAPLVVDSAVVGVLYLDSRAGEPPPQPDVASFCHAVSRVTSLALSSLKRIELAKRQERLDADLRVAQEAQSFLLPPPAGTVGGLRYASRTCPGSVVGGDLFDIFEIDEHRTGICFGDITGHGVAAALLMTAILSHLRATLSRGDDPARAVSDVNAFVAHHSPARMVASLWVGVFDSCSRVLSYVDAGHGHWLVRTAGAAPARPQSPGGTIIGVQPDLEYVAARLELRSRDRVILYSDGLVDQPNTEDERFGRTRLHHVIAGSGSIEGDVAGVFAALEAFKGGRSYADDTTLASIEIRAEP